MKFLLLRGEVPRDRSPVEIMFDTIEEVDDVWTQLVFAMLGPNDYGEVWYWGKERTKVYRPNFVERWVESFDTYDPSFVPDVIFCRGGFIQYHAVLRKFPQSTKLYYGAGRRYLPQKGFSDYDIILQDSPEQVEECKAKFPNSVTTLFIKPAADSIFSPKKVNKIYDVCFPANGSQPFKGHGFVYKTLPKDLTLLNLGNLSKVPMPKNATSIRVLRPQMADYISQCRVGIVAVSGKVDSCPRVIPEMLACDIPVVSFKSVRFWHDKYINSVFSSSSSICSGEIVYESQDFWDVVRYVLNNLNMYNPRKHYEMNLSLKVAAKFLLNKIEEVR